MSTGMETTNNSSSSLTQWDHNLFCLTLAGHLLGREKLVQRLQQALLLFDGREDNNVICLYWRSPLLQVRLHEQSLEFVATGQKVAWIDLTWTLTHKKDMQLVVGQLVLETNSSNENADTMATSTRTGTSSIAAKYYSSPPLTQQHIQQHFEALKVEVSQSLAPTHIYADSIARAFSNLICFSDENQNNKKYSYLSGTSIQLYHEDMQTAAPLYEFDTSSFSELNETVLRLMLLQQQHGHQDESSSPPIDSKESSRGVTAVTEIASAQDLFRQWQTKAAAADAVVQGRATSTESATGTMLASSHEKKRAAADGDDVSSPVAMAALKKIRRYSRLPQLRKTSSKLRYQTTSKK